MRVPFKLWVICTVYVCVCKHKYEPLHVIRHYVFLHDLSALVICRYTYVRRYIAITGVGTKLKVVWYNFVRYNLASIVNRTRDFYSF